MLDVLLADDEARAQGHDGDDVPDQVRLALTSLDVREWLDLEFDDEGNMVSFDVGTVLEAVLGPLAYLTQELAVLYAMDLDEVITLVREWLDGGTPEWPG